MKHQPYENWIVDEVSLNTEQIEALEAHLKVCEVCHQLRQSLENVTQRMQSSPQAGPAPGFSQRWKDSLTERRIWKHKMQTRRLLLLLVTGTVLSFFSLVAYSVATTSPTEIVVAAFQTITRIFVQWDAIQQTLITLYSTVPPVIPIALWIMLAMSAGFLVLVWFVSLWRISTQGVYRK